MVHWVYVLLVCDQLHKVMVGVHFAKRFNAGGRPGDGLAALGGRSFVAARSQADIPQRRQTFRTDGHWFVTLKSFSRSREKIERRSCANSHAAIGTHLKPLYAINYRSNAYKIHHDFQVRTLPFVVHEKEEQTIAPSSPNDFYSSTN